MAIRFRAFLGALGLVLASILITLAIGELIVRFAFPPAPVLLEELLVASGAYEPHPVLGWRPRPNVSYHSSRFDITYETNSRGLRDRERSLERSPGVRRIVVLGDSFTWGWGLHDHEAFPRVLESRLPRTEVVNLGVTAFGLPQEFDYLKLEGVLYQPDIVILALCQNDIYRNVNSLQDLYRAMIAPRVTRVPSGRSKPVKEWLSEHVALYGLVRSAINTNRSLSKTLVALGLRGELHGFEGLDENLMPALRTYPPRLQNSYETTQSELRQMRDWLAERRIRFILALIPAAQAIDSRVFEDTIAYTVFEPADFELDKPYRNLEAFARSHGIEVVNAYLGFKRRVETGVPLYLRNDPHFNAAGHAAFAAEILAYLQRSGELVPPIEPAG